MDSLIIGCVEGAIIFNFKDLTFNRVNDITYGFMTGMALGNFSNDPYKITGLFIGGLVMYLGKKECHLNHWDIFLS